MSKKARVRAALWIAGALAVILLAVIVLYVSGVHYESYALGPTRLFEVKIVGGGGENVWGVKIDPLWKTNGRLRSGQRRIERRPDGSFSIEATNMGQRYPVPDPDAIIFRIRGDDYEQGEREFSLAELDREYYTHTQDDMRVYHLPDFVLEKYEE